MNQRGQFSLGITGYIALGAIAAIGIASATAYIYKSRYEAVRQEYALFVSTVAERGRQAEIKAKAENKLNQERKVKSDEELRKLRIANNEFKRLRDDAPSRRLPEAPADSRNPELSCFDRPELERAYGELVKGLRSLADEGTESAIGLNSARSWAQER